MKIICLDADTLGSDADLSEFKKLGEFKAYGTTRGDETIQRLKDADIVITNKVLITDEVITNTNLKLICVSATGVNNIDLNSAQKHQIPIKNVAGYSTNSVVQQTFASLFELTNHVGYYKNYVSDGGWVKSAIFTHLNHPIMEINGKEFGIIGLGSIGKNVANVAKTFGANVKYFSTSGKNNDTNFAQISLEELLRNSDIISIHSPLNEKTKNLIGKKELEMIKDGAIIMNFGRGGIIDENELAIAIDEKNIRAVLDVLEHEPMLENHPLLNVKNRQNLLITPHVAWASVEARQTLIKLVAKNIENFLSGT